MTDTQPQRNGGPETEHDEAALRDAERKMRGGDAVEGEADKNEADKNEHDKNEHDEKALHDAERKMRDMPGERAG